jgi:hypothetical protein
MSAHSFLSKPDPVLTPEIRELRSSLETHPLFAALDSRARLQAFMQVHVFAVWDFMSLVKRLQRELSCTSLPWMPPSDPEAARLINDIVLGEESDIGANGRAASHLDLYLGAMREVGADTGPFERFLQSLQEGEMVSMALGADEIPWFVREFVCHTLDTALNGSRLQVMASFLYGRENVIPSMFEGLLHSWGIAPESAPQFVYYLRRHIELDADSHGPSAARLIGGELERNPFGLEGARAAARDALAARRQLWDQTLRLLEQPQLRPAPAPVLAPVELPV